MKRIGSILILVIFLGLGALAPSAYAQTTVAGDSGGQWSFSITPYLWAVGIDNKVTVGDYSASSSMSFSDIMKDLQFGAQMHIEARKGNLGFFADPIYLRIRQDTTFQRAYSGTAPPPTRDITLTVDSWLVEFGVIYQVGKWRLDDRQGGRSASLDIYGGGRYWYMHTSLDTSGPVSPTKTVSFMDPMIGLSFKTDLSERMVLNVRGDIGGFSVGSDFSWSAAALFGYRFTPDITGFLGYRALYLDYKSSDSARINMTMRGPITGIEFKF